MVKSDKLFKKNMEGLILRFLLASFLFTFISFPSYSNECKIPAENIEPYLEHYHKSILECSDKDKNSATYIISLNCNGITYIQAYPFGCFNGQFRLLSDLNAREDYNIIRHGLGLLNNVLPSVGSPYIRQDLEPGICLNEQDFNALSKLEPDTGALLRHVGATAGVGVGGAVFIAGGMYVGLGVFTSPVGGGAFLIPAGAGLMVGGSQITSSSFESYSVNNQRRSIEIFLSNVKNDPNQFHSVFLTSKKDSTKYNENAVVQIHDVLNDFKATSCQTQPKLPVAASSNDGFRGGIKETNSVGVGNGYTPSQAREQ